MEPIRSLHLNSARSWRGGERQTLLLVEGLRQQGHLAEIVCPPGTPLSRRASACGVPVHEVPLRGELDLPSALKVRRLIQQIEPHILQMHTAHAHTIGRLAHLGMGDSPAVIVQRRVDFSIHRSGTPGLTRLKYQHGIHRYVAISHKIKAVLEKDGIDSQQIRVVHSGVPPLPEPQKSAQEIGQQLGLPRDTLLLGCVGALSEHKGHRHLLKAMSMMADRRRPPHLVLVGEGELSQELDALAHQYGVAERVHFVGFQKEIASWYHAIDLFLHPSTEEGLGTSILDALAVGKTVIACDVGGIPEVIEDGVTGRLAVAADARSLAEVIDELIDDPATASQLGTAGQQRVYEVFSAEAMVRGNIEVHRELLEELKPKEALQ